MPTYVIVGASRGLGLEMVRQLAARGEAVYACVRSTNDDLKGISGDVTVVEGVDVTTEDGMNALKKGLTGVTIDCLVNNAGSYGSMPPDGDVMKMFQAQKLDAITPEIMRDTFELNTIAPLRITQTLLPQIRAPDGKVIITTSLMGSISDNTSGGSYAYRAAKAAVNQVGKSLAMDLKPKGIAAQLIHPGAVLTGFAGDQAKIPEDFKKSMHDVVPSVHGFIQAIDATTIENTGSFIHANYGEGLKPCPW